MQKSGGQKYLSDLPDKDVMRLASAATVNLQRSLVSLMMFKQECEKRELLHPALVLNNDIPEIAEVCHEWAQNIMEEYE